MVAWRRQNLPEWQRLDRIVNKARSIESQTPAPALTKAEETFEDDEDVVLPFRKPITDDPDPQQLDGIAHATARMRRRRCDRGATSSCQAASSRIGIV